MVFAGTGLLQEVVYLVSQGADPDEIGLMNIDEQLPVLEYPQPGLDIIKVQLIAKKVFSAFGYLFLWFHIYQFISPCVLVLFIIRVALFVGMTQNIIRLF